MGDPAFFSMTDSKPLVTLTSFHGCLVVVLKIRLVLVDFSQVRVLIVLDPSRTLGKIVELCLLRIESNLEILGGACPPNPPIVKSRAKKA